MKHIARDTPNIKFKYIIKKAKLGFHAVVHGNRTVCEDLWEKEKYKIPPGYDIHHINENKADNRIENLECISKSDHTKLYSPHNNQYTKGQKRDTHRPI